MISEKLKEIEERAISDIREIINRVSIETRQIIEQSNGQESLDLKEYTTPPSPTTREHYPEFSFNPTDEQIRANELASSGQDLKIEAYSGSGKTSLLEIISQTSLAGKKVLYLAYNKAIATDAQSKFPRNVSCLTTHSLAYRELVRSGKLKQERISGGLYPAQIVKMLSVEDGVSKLTNFGLAAYALDIVKNYCHSNDTVISKKHRRSTIISAIPKDERKIVNQAGVNLAKEIWTRVVNPDDNFPILHDYYLKIWTLQSPTLDFDTILVDEAQDSNAAIIGVLHKQNAQLIWVGDRYQSIYGWRGATNALSQVQSSCSATITQSFRYGSEIATLASKVLSKGYKSPILIKGNDSVASKIGFIKIPKAIISRTNAVLISEISRFNRANPSLKIYIEGGAAPLKRLVQGICDLQRGKRTLVPELASFESWSEVEEHSKKPEGISLKGIAKLAKDTNLERVLKLLESRSITESQYAADTIFTTAHKAKGKEYPSVSLTDDFSVITDETHKEEVNLLYVALTRAIHELDINQCTAAQCFVE